MCGNKAGLDKRPSLRKGGEVSTCDGVGLIEGSGSERNHNWEVVFEILFWKLPFGSWLLCLNGRGSPEP